MGAFKDDFVAWKSTLTIDEQKLIQKQAQNEFNKKYRSSDEFQKDLPDEKVASFANILSKFFESEAEDFKKERDTRTPEYDALLQKAKGASFDFSLTSSIVEIDRDAGRRYNFAYWKNLQARSNGEKYPAAACIKDKWTVLNDTPEAHEANLAIWQQAKETFQGKDPEGFFAQSVPPLGTEWTVELPRIPMQRIQTMHTLLVKEVEEKAQNLTEAELDPWVEGKYKQLFTEAEEVIDTWRAASQEIETLAQNAKEFYRSQKDVKGKTKADVLKEIWAELPKWVGKPVPAIDEEVLAELATEPATGPDFRHPWGIADKLYKSEAIDAFGQKYLLGIYETKEEAAKSFSEWNAEYEKARVAMKSEMQEWGKQEQAKLEADKESQDRIKAMLEEARR